MSLGLRERVRAREVVLGTFIKTPSRHVAEVLGRAGLDFAIVDAEHGPFDLAAIDDVVLGARSADLPCLVRTPDRDPIFVGRCFDLGAAGVLVPHVTSAEAARGVVAAAKYSHKERGFSPSTRAGGYGIGETAAAYRVRADRESCVWCQVEDRETFAHLDDLAAVDEVDCLFLGRADLALSLGVEGQDDPAVRSAVKATAEAGARRGRPIGIYISHTEEIPELLALGITVFVCGSDHGFLMDHGRRNRAELNRAVAGARG